ncbi:MAG: hypothetical protein ACYDEB_08950 [Dehalococcoidia bacterium]
MVRAAVFAALMPVLLAFAACGGSGTTTTSRTVGPGLAQRPATTMSAGAGIAQRAHTGVPALDQALDAALASDSIEMARLTGYEKVPCAAQADATHPACRLKEKPGAPVEILPKLGCQSGWLRPEDVPPAYGDALTGKSPKLLAVYQPAAGVDKYGAQYIAVIGTGNHADGAAAAIALHIKDGRITALEDDCGSVLKLLDFSRVATWVLRPGATAPDPTPTVPAASRTP